MTNTIVCVTTETTPIDWETRTKSWTVAELRETFPEGEGTIVDGLLTHIESLRSQLTASGKPAWQPIETAPKDGTDLLGYREDAGIFMIRWTSASELFSEQEIERMCQEHPDDDGEWIFDQAWMFADFVRGDRLDGDLVPTHWMPLPEFPNV